MKPSECRPDRRRSFLPLLAVAIGLCAQSAAYAVTDDQKDLRIAECLSRHLNERFLEHRGDTDFGIGIIADPHCNDPAGHRGMSTINIWHAESLDLTIIVGDLSVGTGTELRKYVADAPGNFKWPYAGTHVTIQAGKPVKRTWPRTPRAAPPCVLTMGNHEIHFGKRSYVEVLYPGAVADASLWIHDATAYRNEGPRPNGNGNYVFYSFNYGALHFVALDAWGMGRPAGQNAIPPHQMKWLEADLQAHRHMETVVLNHSPVETASPDLLLRNRLQLMAVLKQHPHVKWYFSGHQHGYSWVKWAHVNVFRTGLGEAGRYGSGALIVKDGPARWRVWDDHYWYAPDHWKDRKRVMYHRVLTPDKPSQTIQTPIPDPPAKSDNAPPAAPAHLRAQRRGKSAIRLQWAPAAGADYYDVHRDGKRIGGSLYPRFADHDVEAGRSYKYEVWARDVTGQKSPTAAAGEVRARDD